MGHTQATILPTHTPDDFARSTMIAARAILDGCIVALPTETVYGLAADGTNAQAVRSIFEIKGRPAHNPLILHVASLKMAKAFSSEWTGQAQKLADAFWPGPLTIVLRKSQTIPDVVTAGGPTVALRWPSHPFIQAVIRESGKPLAAPSANLSNRISPTCAGHVRSQLGDRVPFIVDGGHSQVGIESTVVDLTVAPARILRPGMIHTESIAAVIGDVTDAASNPFDPTLKSPGQLLKHYSPQARLRIRSWSNDQEFRKVITATESDQHRIHVITHTHIPADALGTEVAVIPHDAEAFARALYSELHRCDEAGAEWIIVESLPESPDWSGITDRLTRASRD